MRKRRTSTHLSTFSLRLLWGILLCSLSACLQPADDPRLGATLTPIILLPVEGTPLPPVLPIINPTGTQFATPSAPLQQNISTLSPPEQTATFVAFADLKPATSPTPTASAFDLSQLQAAWTPMPLPDGMSDALPVMSGICFESAWDAAGRVFVLRNPDEQRALYDGADNSRLCRRPVQRYDFDFSEGRVLAGIWSRGMGCTAQHDVLDYQRDDANRRIRLSLRLRTEGDCPYELVRPFWVSIPRASDYEIVLDVLDPSRP